jgi:hypothetical protein
MFAKPAQPVRASVGLFFIFSCLWAGVLYKEPIDPRKKEDPDFVYECYLDQWRKKYLDSNRK